MMSMQLFFLVPLRMNEQPKRRTRSKSWIPIKGVFNLKVYRNDELVEEYEDNNLVVTLGKQCMAILLGDADANKQITQIGFGTGTSAPLITDTVLTGSFVKDIDSADYPATNQVRFTWVLQSSEANGTAITEYGLLAEDDTLFARKTKEVINKTSDLRLEGTWTIIF